MSALPGVFALMGVIVLAWVQANDQQNQQNSRTHLNNVCTNVCHITYIT